MRGGFVAPQKNDPGFGGRKRRTMRGGFRGGLDPCINHPYC